MANTLTSTGQRNMRRQLFLYLLIAAMIPILCLHAAQPPEVQQKKPISPDAPESVIGPPGEGYVVIAEEGSVQLSVQFPGDVIRSRSSISLGDKKYFGSCWTASVESARYAANVVKLDKEPTEQFFADLVRLEAEKLAHEIKGLPGKKRTVQSGVFEGFERDVVGGVWKDKRAAGRVRSFHVGNFVITLSVVQEGTKVDDKAANAYFETLVYASVDRIPDDGKEGKP